MERRMKLLVVDDNPINVEIVKELLDGKFDISAATYGEDAIRLADELTPDVILLDIMMPGMDGYEACRLLRQQPALRNTRIIIVSAKAMAADRQAAFDAGADEFVSKPFTESELLLTLREHVGAG